MLRISPSLRTTALHALRPQLQATLSPTALRAIHVSAPCLQTVKRDSDAETGLYYHEIGNGTWAVSLLERAPKDSMSLSVIGHISPGSSDPSEFVRTNPDNIRMNAGFWNALHRVLKEQIPDDINLKFEAEMRENGWAHLCGTYTCSPRRTTRCHAGPHFATRGNFWKCGIY